MHLMRNDTCRCSYCCLSCHMMLIHWIGICTKNSVKNVNLFSIEIKMLIWTFDVIIIEYLWKHIINKSKILLIIESKVEESARFCQLLSHEDKNVFDFLLTKRQSYFIPSYYNKMKIWPKRYNKFFISYNKIIKINLNFLSAEALCLHLLIQKPIEVKCFNLFLIHFHNKLFSKEIISLWKFGHNQATLYSRQHFYKRPKSQNRKHIINSQIPIKFNQNRVKTQRTVSGHSQINITIRESPLLLCSHDQILSTTCL